MGLHDVVEVRVARFPALSEVARDAARLAERFDAVVTEIETIYGAVARLEHTIARLVLILLKITISVAAIVTLVSAVSRVLMALWHW